MHGVIAQLCALALRGGAQRVVTLATSASSRVGDLEIWPSQKGVSTKMATDASDFALGGHTLDGPFVVSRE